MGKERISFKTQFRVYFFHFFQRSKRNAKYDGPCIINPHVKNKLIKIVTVDDQ